MENHLIGIRKSDDTSENLPQLLRPGCLKMKRGIENIFVYGKQRKPKGHLERANQGRFQKRNIFVYPLVILQNVMCSLLAFATLFHQVSSVVFM